MYATFIEIINALFTVIGIFVGLHLIVWAIASGYFRAKRNAARAQRQEMMKGLTGALDHAIKACEKHSQTHKVEKKAPARKR